MSKDNQPNSEYVYAIEEINGDHIKIGRSSNPNNRIKSLSTSTPYDLKIISKAKVNNAVDVEKLLHEKYDKYRVNGEWFSVNEDIRSKIKSDIENYNKSANSDVDIPISEMQFEILKYLLIDGANGPKGLSEGIERPTESVSRCLSSLKDKSLVYDKCGGVWSLTTEGLTLIRACIKEAEKQKTFSEI